MEGGFFSWAQKHEEKNREAKIEIEKEEGGIRQKIENFMTIKQSPEVLMYLLNFSSRAQSYVIRVNQDRSPFFHFYTYSLIFINQCQIYMSNVLRALHSQ